MRGRFLRTKRDQQARLAELHARVHPPTVKPAEADVATLVRIEVERQRREDRQAQERAESARFIGGPCWACGTTWAETVDWRGGEPEPDWHHDARGPICGTC